MNFEKAVANVFDIDLQRTENRINTIVRGLVEQSVSWEFAFTKKAVYSTICIIFEREMGSRISGFEREYVYRQIWGRYKAQLKEQKKNVGDANDE
jgi:hypothetical protein